jgi:S1-C subfamily serine protease
MPDVTTIDRWPAAIAEDPLEEADAVPANARRSTPFRRSAHSGDVNAAAVCHDRPMLNELSNQMADAVAAVAPSVVQVQGRRRPVSGLVYGDGIVVTTARALGRENGLRVRSHEGEIHEAELAGWDPTTNLAVLRATGLHAAAIAPAETAPRVGHLALAIARSWSNAVTASAGIVSVIGGPLPTGRHRAIDQVIRTTAPMHDGFAGGAFIDTGGGLLGVATSAAIRGLGVVIPAAIAWKAAATVLEHGRMTRGYLGVAGQAVLLPENQRGARGSSEPGEGAGRAVLIVGVTDGSPAAAAGILVGDILLSFDRRAITSSEELMDLLQQTPAGKTAALGVLRGGSPVDLTVTVGERPRG